LAQYSVRPINSSQLPWNGAKHAGYPRGLGIDHSGGHGVEVCISGAIHSIQAAADLITQPPIKIIQSSADSLRPRGCSPGCPGRVGQLRPEPVLYRVDFHGDSVVSGADSEFLQD
jgi:hypothetical protein